MGVAPSLSLSSIPADVRSAVFFKKLTSAPVLADVANNIRTGHAKHIMVLCGAGISVAAGIPDFRSPGTGLYSSLDKYGLPYPEAVFDISFFRTNPRPFFHLARELYPGAFLPTRTHYFLRLLAEKGLLQRVYTQNIDTLERIAGVPSDLLVEAHGSFATSTCVGCHRRYPQQWMRDAIMQPAVATGADSGIIVPRCEVCGDVVKPDITFFGESLPARYHQLIKPDAREADLLIVIGTSLKVAPVATIPAIVGAQIPRLLINREAVNVAVARPHCDDDEDGALGAHAGSDEDEDSAASAAASALQTAHARGASARTDEVKLEEDDDIDALNGFLFYHRGNYRDVLCQADADDGVALLAQACGWERELDELMLREHARLKVESAAAAAAARSSAPVAHAAAAPTIKPEPLHAVAITLAAADAATDAARREYDTAVDGAGLDVLAQAMADLDMSVPASSTAASVAAASATGSPAAMASAASGGAFL